MPEIIADKNDDRAPLEKMEEIVDKCDGHVVVISEREGFTILWFNEPDVIANACAIDKDAQSPMWDVLQQVGITVHQAKNLDEALKLARTLWSDDNEPH